MISRCLFFRGQLQIKKTFKQFKRKDERKRIRIVDIDLLNSTCISEIFHLGKSVNPIAEKCWSDQGCLLSVKPQEGYWNVKLTPKYWGQMESQEKKLGWCKVYQSGIWWKSRCSKLISVTYFPTESLLGQNTWIHDQLSQLMSLNFLKIVRNLNDILKKKKKKKKKKIHSMQILQNPLDYISINMRTW